MALYSERRGDYEQYRTDYRDSVENYIEKLRAEADAHREANAAEILRDREAARQRFLKMLGSPLCEPHRRAPMNVWMSFVASDDDADIYRMQFEIFPGFRFYGMLFRKGGEKRPLVIVSHGGGGTPELCAELTGRTNYHNLARRTVRSGAHAFLPQFIIWDKATFGAEYDRVLLDNRLKQLGGSVTALELFCLRRCVDWFEETQSAWAQTDRLGMVGLSYGGFYTLFAAAADTRIKYAVSSCFFNRRYDYSWYDWTWKNAANEFLDAEIAMLICPRKLDIQVGTNDELFSIAGARAEYERLVRLCPGDWARFSEFDGTHEFYFADDTPFERMMDSL